jgi:VanZ family protein
MAARIQSPAAVLGMRRLWLALGWGLVLLVIYLSLTPAPVQIEVEQGDKFGHIFAYAALMSWFANLYETPVRRLQFAIGFVALGVALEFAQRETGYRTFEVADMAADAVGVIAAWLFAPPRIPNYLHGVEKLLLRA